MINVIIVDDHQMVIDGLRAVMDTTDHINVLGEANSGKDAFQLLRKNEGIDIVLLDINMPDMDGIETTRKIREDHPNVRILILTMYDKPEFVKNLLELGASGYILKNAGRDELLMAIDKISRGEDYFDEKVIKNVMSSFKPGSVMNPIKLTKRETDVLRLITQEYKTAEIAEELCVSTHTVDTHRKNLLSKLHVRNTAGLVKYAIAVGIYNE